MCISTVVLLVNTCTCILQHYTFLFYYTLYEKMYNYVHLNPPLDNIHIYLSVYMSVCLVL